MPVPIRTLKVRPNPWIEIGPTGLPCGVVAYEQPAGGFDPRLVGASRTNVQKVQDAPKGAPLGQAVHTFDVQYTDEDVLLPNTPYYRRRIARGEMIAVDRPTYVAAVGTAKGFEDQAKLVEQIKREAIRAFDAANGEGAFAALAEHRASLAKEAAEVKAAAAANQDPRVLSEGELKKLADAQQPAPVKSDSKKGDAG